MPAMKRLALAAEDIVWRVVSWLMDRATRP
jgi:hypothetical protein